MSEVRGERDWLLRATSIIDSKKIALTTKTPSHQENKDPILVNFFNEAVGWRVNGFYSNSMGYKKKEIFPR
jgi:hypothetical protein